MKKLIAVLLLTLLVLAGCGTPAEPETLSPVYTDWSKLTPYEPPRPVYTLHGGYSASGPFEARDDYGPLLPYIGRYSTMERYVIDYLPFFGLVTSKGELVSGPVYTRVNFYDGFLVLCRETARETSSCTLAAADGRWAYELKDSRYVASGSGLLMTVTSGGDLDLWNTEGEVVAHFDSGLFTSRFGKVLNWGGEGGPYVDWTDDKVGYGVSYLVNGEYQDEGVRFYLDFSSGAVTDLPPEGCGAEIDYSAIISDTPAPPEIEGCSYLDPITDPVTGETYFYGYCRSENGEGRYALFDGGGRMLVENCDLMRFEQPVIVRGGLCSTVEDGCFCFRALAGNALVFRCPMGTNSD